MLRRALLVALSSALFSCGGDGDSAPEYSAAEAREETAGGTGTETPPEETVPEGRLPEGVTPLRYSLWLEVVPSRERFRGRVEIDTRLDAETDLIWMHGQDMNVTEAEVLPEGREGVLARFEQVNESGVAALRLDSPVGPGEVVISLTYDAPFDRQLKGLYRVDTGGDSYAFTQFEATSARYCFPSFDEPRFKTPFDITLAVQPGQVAIANTSERSTRTIAGLEEHRFTTTEALPTYLVAMAVGPLDVVEHDPIPANDVRDHPLPFRGVAARGRGAQLAFALENTAALLADLETYFGTPYPYDKLDIIAVPDFASGAMENAGAITFRETYLLIDEENAPRAQIRGFTYVMAHELAHQWFGNLVTMPWWDDIWLNEAFATWMGMNTVHRVDPDFQADLGMLEMVQGAMGADSLVSARQIRQPIDTNHDIRNAFDSITYRKGGGVLGMFERWLGEETFRDGIREHMNRHRFGTATADDLLESLTQVAGFDVGTPFRTFLSQPGVPLLSAERACSDEGNHVSVHQQRYLPIGSTGSTEQTWQIPVCIRYGRGRETQEACALITEASAEIEIEGGCPDWIMPNAQGAGYYRWRMPAEELTLLMSRGWSRLTDRERLSTADNLRAGFDAGIVPAPAVFGAFDRIAQDVTRQVATAPMGLAGWTRHHALAENETLLLRFESWAAGLYDARARRLGWAPRRGRTEDNATGLLRATTLSFLAHTARSDRIRREAAERGRRYIGFGGDSEIHPEAVGANMVGLALTTAVQESDAELFDALIARLFASEDALFRGRALSALGSTHDPVLGRRAMELVLDERLRINEVTTTVRQQMNMHETHATAWDWFREHFDAVFARVATTRAGHAPWYTTSFCSEERAAEVATFFESRIEALPGGPRNLAGALELIRLCAARRIAQQEHVEAFFRTTR